MWGQSSDREKGLKGISMATFPIEGTQLPSLLSAPWTKSLHLQRAYGTSLLFWKMPRAPTSRSSVASQQLLTAIATSWLPTYLQVVAFVTGIIVRPSCFEG